MDIGYFSNYLNVYGIPETPFQGLSSVAIVCVCVCVTYHVLEMSYASLVTNALMSRPFGTTGWCLWYS